ncbi:MAG: DUF106 domain-containing protein [Deltaproteobacteria bacterium]|nr:DUF106 domain-containing protein [Deltaproteobacteria bacterium]
MESFLDTLWLKTEAVVQHIKALLDAAISPLNALGPAGAIFVLAFLTVLLAKFFSKKFNTKRYRLLKEQFQYWYNLRQEANSCADPEKATLLKRNIDQAELNRVYYDYFFEGLMKSLLTTYLPLLLMLAYVNEAFQPSLLLERFGRAYVLKVPTFSGEPVLLGGVFWFFLSVLFSYGVCSLGKKIVSKAQTRPHSREKT